MLISAEDCIKILRFTFYQHYIDPCSRAFVCAMRVFFAYEDGVMKLCKARLATCLTSRLLILLHFLHAVVKRAHV